MFRYLLNAVADKLGCTVSSRRLPSSTSLLLEREPAGNEPTRTNEATSEWAKTTVVPQVAKTTVDAPINEPVKSTVVEETIVSTTEESREKGSDDESSTGGRSRETSLNTSRAFHEADQKYGERIADDALVTFCDRLKTALSKTNTSYKFEGWVGINEVLIFARLVVAKRELENAKLKNDKKAVKELESELAASGEVQKEVEKAITGQHRVAQILYDASRLHYVVVYRSPRRKELTLYDSFLDEKHPERSLKNISDQILALFGHLYPNESIPIDIALNYEQQDDDWSCGYRAIACILDLVIEGHPCNKTYNLEEIHTFLIDCLDTPEVSIASFENASEKISQRKWFPDRTDEEYTYYIPRGGREKEETDENNNEEK